MVLEHRLFYHCELVCFWHIFKGLVFNEIAVVDLFPIFTVQVKELPRGHTFLMSEAGQTCLDKTNFTRVFFESSGDDSFVLDWVQGARAICNLATDLQQLNSTLKNCNLKWV